MNGIKLRASHAPVWWHCAASIDLPRLEPSDDSTAVEGSIVHFMAFRRAQENTSESGIEIVVTEEMREAAQGFVDYCNDLRCDLNAREVTFGGAIMPPEMGGTADYIGYDSRNRVLHIVDLKYGHSSVAAKDNAQLLVYSLGAVGYFKQMDTLEIKLHIYQPRDYINGTVKVWVLNAIDWQEQIKELETRGANALHSIVANTGSHCRYCRSRVYCTAFLESAGSVLETVQSRPEALELTPEAIGAEYEYLLRAESLAKSARKGFEELITQNIESGTSIPGWTIGSTNGRYKWSADIETIKGVAELSGIKLTEEKPISIAVARKTPGVIESLMTKSNGTKRLVPFDESIVEEVFK